MQRQGQVALPPDLVEVDVGREPVPVQRSADGEDFRSAGDLALCLERAGRQPVESGDDRARTGIGLDIARNMHLEP